MEFLIPAMLVLMGVMLFMGTRKQKRQMAEMQEMQESLTTGTRVQLMSGLFGTVIDANRDFVDVEIAPGVVARYNKLAVRGVVPSDEAADTYVGAVLADEDAEPDTALEPGAGKTDDPADEK
ncbi:preprotein translocase subunit YajC [Gordonia sp. (in: high G+C Gram-positive bacteria)]|uniref:preprotein translocase subunit YajC n=1 Tax=Gordonia sp. (in: high G+C Gram-positive bacteria) TaxID=84139 RepID=UPI0039E2BCBC